LGIYFLCGSSGILIQRPLLRPYHSPQSHALLPGPGSAGSGRALSSSGSELLSFRVTMTASARARHRATVTGPVEAAGPGHWQLRRVTLSPWAQSLGPRHRRRAGRRLRRGEPAAMPGQLPSLSRRPGAHPPGPAVTARRPPVTHRAAACQWARPGTKWPQLRVAILLGDSESLTVTRTVSP
jgi:hypothetical protein